MANRFEVGCLAIGWVLLLLCPGVRLQDGSRPPLQNEFPTKCLGDLGCFSTDVPYFHPLLRPLSLLPFDEEHITTRFWHFGPRNVQEGSLLEPHLESLQSSGFMPQLLTKVIIHGFTVVPHKGDVHHIMKDVLFMCKLYNVIVVDWSDSAKPPYPQAVANGRVVGAQIARLIQFLQETVGLQPETVHLIGHSLGAQIAGWAGERIPNLGRITGLDPAGPYFYSAPPAARLDHTDAAFVDIIHTNAGNNLLEGLGLEEAVGHLDFYPNGGQHQPGCLQESMGVLAAANAAVNAAVNAAANASQAMVPDYMTLESSCSHGRALALFIASILSDQCRFEGVACDSAQSFAEGHCAAPHRRWKTVVPVKHEMGLHARKPHFAAPGRKYFLYTSAESPFCVSNILLSVPRPYN